MYRGFAWYRQLVGTSEPDPSTHIDTLHNRPVSTREYVTDAARVVTETNQAVGPTSKEPQELAVPKKIKNNLENKTPSNRWDMITSKSEDSTTAVAKPKIIDKSKRRVSIILPAVGSGYAVEEEEDSDLPNGSQSARNPQSNGLDTGLHYGRYDYQNYYTDKDSPQGKPPRNFMLVPDKSRRSKPRWTRRIKAAAGRMSQGVLRPLSGNSTVRPTSAAGGSYDEEEQKEIDELRELFEAFDINHSGYISSTELGEATRALGMNLGREQLEKTIRDFDTDGNNRIDFHEFCQAIRRMASRTNGWQSAIGQCFRVFDRTDTGYITEVEFRYVLRELGQIDDERIIDQVFAEVDIGRNGVIEKMEFENFVRSYLTEEDIIEDQKQNEDPNGSIFQ